ncbi:MAG: class I SAM-dependent methyltransferase [Candidatus Nitrotoga sp.]
MQPKEHWENIHTSKPADTVSWYQEHAKHSLRLITRTGVPKSASIIDVGGGTSTLVDDLLDKGYTALTVLDISASALLTSQQRLARRANLVRWTEANVSDAPLGSHQYDVWHDRAVFHFLTREDERHAYVATVMRAVKPGGHVIVSTFAEDGPLQCSGLSVVRYSAEALHAAFGNPFTLVQHEKDDHLTPSGNVQKFIYCYCRKTAS